MKIKLLRSMGFIVFFITAGLFAKAQSNSQYFIPLAFPKSPNSTQFVKYGDYPVNLYSGLPEISIPLYTVEAGGLSVPITLSYHASGLMVNEAASWVGAGWSVSAGGSITRKIEGQPDEGGYFAGWRDATQLNPTTNFDDLQYLNNVAQSKNNSSYDTRPDIFSYDIPGHSGKFFFNSNRHYEVEKIPYAPLLITNTATPFVTATPKFTVTDDHGNIFILGNTATETTATESDLGSDNSGVTAWMLESMISQNRRDTISFSYNQQNIKNPYQTGQIVSIDDQGYIPLPGSGCDNYVHALQPPQDAGTISYVNEQDIGQINFKNGKVQFNLTTARRTDFPNNGDPTTNVYYLDNIQVSAYNYGTKVFELQKEIKFYDSYFTGVSGTQGRLRLDSIQILDKAGAITQHYRFDYNQQPVPAYTSYSKDFWGYYNGKMDNPSITQTLIPQTQVSYQFVQGGPVTQITIGSNDPTSRDPDSTQMQAGVLTGIHYPTGGYTNFTYQTNRYFDAANVMHLTGGLRIASISSYDGVSPTPIVKTYQYNNATSNFMTDFSGLINYSFFLSTVTGRDFAENSGPPFICATKRIRTYFSESVVSLTPTEGNPVAYTNVTEYTGTPGSNVGKSVYTYRYKADEWDGSALATGVPVIDDYFYARGQLTSKSDFIREPGGTYQVVKRQINNYNAFPVTSVYDTVGMVVGQIQTTDGVIGLADPASVGPSAGDGLRFPFHDYVIVSDDNYLVNTTINNYDTSDTTKFTSSTISYAYDDTTHQQIINTTHIDSKGNAHITNNKYAYDYLTGGTTNNTVLDAMISRRMFGEVIEKTDNLVNLATSVTAVTGAQLNYYGFGSITGTIVPAKISTLSVAAPITNFTPSSVVSGNLTGDSRYLQMISFDQYDSQNNITQYTPRNATPTSILWDYLHELPIAQVKNSIVTNAAYTSFEADGNGGWTYSGKPLFDPTAPTGKLVYPLSAGNVVSPVVSTSIPYVLSYWSNSGAANVSPALGSPLAGLTTANGWTYYEYQVPAGTSQVTISGTTSIDELRLYPAAAQMTTYAYDPSGLRSISDTKGTNSYFEYDYFQRLRNIKDWSSNIVKNYGYHTYDQIFGNQVQTATFTRNNCPFGYTPGSLIYTVAANKYYSSTLASANTDAIYDMNTNGQINANANCTCMVTLISVSVTNSTGKPNYPIYFSGITAPFNVPTGTSNISVPEGSYTSVQVGPVDSNSYDFIMGTRPAQNDVHYGTFTGVSIIPGSSDLTISITNYP